MGNLDIFFLNQIICITKALGEHGIILNLDDMQMGRLSPKLIVGGNIPISTHYPIPITPEIKEKMSKLGLTDFWDFYFYEETKIKRQKQEEKKEKSKKKRWFLF